MILKDIHSMTLIEAIAYYTSIVAQASQKRDYSYKDEILQFKKQLHERIENEFKTN